MKRFLMFAIIAAVFMVTSPVQAAQGQMYASGNLAFGILTDMEDEGVEISFDPGWGLIAAVGYDLGVYRVEGEIGYRMFDTDEIVVPGVGTFSLDGDVSVLTFMVNGYYDVAMGGPLTPYMGFGLGLVNADFEATVPGFGTVSESDTEFAYQLMLGAGFEMNPNMVLTAGYRFFGFTDNDGAFSHELNIGARFYF